MRAIPRRSIFSAARSPRPAMPRRSSTSSPIPRRSRPSGGNSPRTSMRTGLRSSSEQRERPPMKKSTRVNHPPRVELAGDNHPLVAPIYQTVKFEFESLADTEAYLRGERPGFFYTRTSNPTTRQLEQLLAELHRRQHCLLTASPLPALSPPLLALT